jgi:hypothetical protein
MKGGRDRRGRLSKEEGGKAKDGEIKEINNRRKTKEDRSGKKVNPYTEIRK